MTTDAIELRTQAEVTRETIRERLIEARWKVDSGKLEGTEVVSFEDAIGALTSAIPPSSRSSADVRTPGRVVVSAVCPRCREVGLITLELSTILQVDSKGAELRLKGASKAASHVCGQTSLSDASDQLGAFDITDIVGDDPPLRGLLLRVGYDVPADVIGGWALETQTALAVWAQVQLEPSGEEGVEMNVQLAPETRKVLDGYERKVGE